LRFRDFLRNHDDWRKRYDAEKLRLVNVEKLRRSEYTDAKSPCISEILSAAARWQPPSGTVLGLLGAAAGGKNTLEFLRERFPHSNLQLVDLAAARIEPYSYGEKGDAIEDEFKSLVDAMVAADLTVFATPVYWYGMSGHMKNFFDRFSNLLRGRYKHMGEKFYGKKFSVLVTGSDAQLPYGFEVPFISTALYFGMDYLGASYKQFG
jgi:hypothetical protein